MSADNCIAILETRGEYRVAHCQAIENIFIYDSHDHTFSKSPDPEMVLAYFGQSNVFSSYNDASEYAFTLHDEIGYTEYGVCTYREWSDRYFSEIIDGVVVIREPVE